MHFSQSFRALASAAILSLAAVTASADSVTLSSSTVGNTDKTSAWWTAFSDGVTIPTGKTLTFKFTNHAGSANWNNWILVAANKERGESDYKEYFLLRSDNYGWGGDSYNGDVYTNNFTELASKGTDVWANYHDLMDGAEVTMKISNSSTGLVFVNITAKSTSGTDLVSRYYAPCPGDVVVFLSVENSYISGLTAELESEDLTVTNVTFANAEGVTHYFAPGESTTPFIKASVIATATMSDGTTAQLPESYVTTSTSITKDGEYTASYGKFSYSGKANVSNATCTIVGTTAYPGWGTYTDNVQVKKGETVSQSFQARTQTVTLYYSPVVLIANSVGTDAAFRCDKYAWGAAGNKNDNPELFGTVASSFILAPNWGNYFDGAMFTISVTNNGSTIDLSIEATDAVGKWRSTTFKGIPATTISAADEDDVYFKVTTDHTYFLIPSAESSALRQVADGVDVKVEGGNIEVSGAESFEVYDMNGRKVSSTGLTRGLYIVRTAGVAKKIIIK